jgi:replicative DNA helicase
MLSLEDLVDKRAERSVLGAVLINGTLFHKVASMDPMHFYYQDHQAIFTQMLNLFSKQEDINSSSVAEAFVKEKSIAKLVFGLDGCEEGYSVTDIDNGSRLDWFRGHLIGLAKRREARQMGEDIMDAALDTENKQYLETAQAVLINLSNAFEEEKKKSFSESLDEALDAIRQDMDTSKPRGISTGIKCLDYHTKGMLPEQLITIAARSGGGKSALALNIAEHVVMKENKKILYFSLEMSDVQLLDRLIRSVSGSESDLNAMALAKRKILDKEKNFIINTTPGLTLSAIQAECFKKKQANPDLALIIIDHIALITAEPGAKFQSKTYEIQEVTKRLKVLARHLQIPIIQLAQQNRNVDARQDKRPIKSDLKDSDSIVHDSDVVLFVSITRDEDRTPTGEAVLSIAKNRMGSEVDLDILFRAPITKFMDKSYPGPRY